MKLLDAVMENGFVNLPAVPNWFEQHELERLDALTEQLPTERVYLGDAGEPNSTDVGRVMTDHDVPRPVGGACGAEILRMLSSPRVREQYVALLDGAEPVIRRAQVNILRAGSYIGRHLDRDSNPDYAVALVIHFGDDYVGGDFVAHPPSGPRRLRAEPGTVTISYCGVEHEVERVEAGKRKSLVYFVSSQKDENRRARSSAGRRSYASAM